MDKSQYDEGFKNRRDAEVLFGIAATFGSVEAQLLVKSWSRCTLWMEAFVKANLAQASYVRWRFRE